MTMEAGLVERSREKIGHAHRIIKKRRFRRRPEHPRPAPARVPTPLQRLFVSCLDVFKGPGTVPLPCDVQKLCHILDGMMPEDVGLVRGLQFFSPEDDSVPGARRVMYTTIYKCENFSLCLLFLPPNAVIPLHNHPGMTVFSKLLLGTMHIKAYDWATPLNSDAQTSQPRLARLKSDETFTAPCDTSVLYPTSGGNIHAFTAITSCAVLDVLGPPYSHEDGRDCSYYREVPCSDVSSNGERAGEEAEGEGKGYGWLEEIEVPEDSQMDVIEYMGPQVYEPFCS